MKKRNLIISGEFTMTEVANADTQAQSQNTTAPKAKSAATRIAALKAAGVDVSNYFPMGEEMVVKVVDGVPVQVTDDDPVFASIAGGGHIRNYTLYRRWVMSQMFHMLDRMERQNVSFNALLQDKGYAYQWRMLEKELLDQYKMLKHKDKVCYEQRALWFNGRVASYMAFDYVQKLRSYVEKLLRQGSHTCKGKPYVRLSRENIFVSDLESKLYSPFRDLALAMNDVNGERLYRLVVKFNKLMKRLPADTKQSEAFINAYKGSGAYFTMRNMVLFHGARFKQGRRNMSEAKSLEHIESKAAEYARGDEGWRLLGVLKQLIADSDMSVSDKIDEWANR